MNEERTRRELQLLELLKRVEERNYDLAGVPRNRLWREVEEIQRNKPIENSGPVLG